MGWFMKKLEGKFTSAVIVAAGRGTRMNMDINKQYMEISGKQVLARTLQVIEDCEYVNEIVLVVNPLDIMYCKQSIIDIYGFEKVKTIVAGGNERQNSVYNGLLEVSKDCEILIIHDGARPFLEEKNIIDSITAALEFGSACTAVPVKDTIKSVDSENFVLETPDRKKLWAIQTPQTFKYSIIMEAHARAIREGYIGTDDAVLVERLGIPTKLVMGSYFNIKITTKEDIVLAEAIVNSVDY